MADFGDQLGAVMVGLIRARRIADEQTAALAEYYKTNPLLEGLSVPRIRIPEFRLELPLLIEDYMPGRPGRLEDTCGLIGEMHESLETEISKAGKSLPEEFYSKFASELEKLLELLSHSHAPLMRESVSRSVQKALVSALEATHPDLTAAEKACLMSSLRARVYSTDRIKASVPPGVEANILTAEVKEHSSPHNVVRVQITLKEEGLEWAVHASGCGGETRTLQPE